MEPLPASQYSLACVDDKDAAVRIFDSSGLRPYKPKEGMRLDQRFEPAGSQMGACRTPSVPFFTRGLPAKGTYTRWHILATFQEHINYDLIFAQSLVVLHDAPTEVLSLSTSHKLSECPF